MRFFRPQLSSVSDELVRKQAELKNLRSALAAEGETLTRSAAEQAGKSIALAESSAALQASSSS